jgi:hypothetical protein
MRREMMKIAIVGPEVSLSPIGSLALALLVALVWDEARSGHGAWRWHMDVLVCANHSGGLVDRNAHMATISALAAIPFILADTTLDANACITAATAWALAVAALLALAAALATRLGREILFVGSELGVVLVERGR